jgi:asparagine synthase (glutamine-hydrolysing)
MCGIAGGVGVGMEQYLRTNIKLLRNRGPDSQGILSIDNNLILAASRLAMTDPNPRSNQPMQDHYSKNSIVFNGEIYNFRDLRKKLLLSQIRFNTESDTEVILKSLQNNGNQVIKNFEGMFAFAYHNYQENKLVFARDYLGKKTAFLFHQ